MSADAPSRSQLTATRFAFLGDGLYPGDGGAELERLWQLINWRPIRGCDGRFTSRDRALGALSLHQLCELYGIAACSPVVSCRRMGESVDGVEAVRLRGGGGLLSYCKADGTTVHTLNTESGLARKLLALDACEPLLAVLPAAQRLLFSSACSVLDAVAEPERTAVAPALVCALRCAGARRAARLPSGGVSAPLEAAATMTNLLSLPADVLAGSVLLAGGGDVPSIGAAASTCSALAALCETEGVWAALCAAQGLMAADGSTPRATLRRAALCAHAEQWPSSEYEWACDAPPAGGVGALRCRCSHCGRTYDVSLATGFVDTRAFASKLVTRADFRARCAAPRHQRTWTVVWDRMAAADAKAAMVAAAASWEGVSFGPQYGTRRPEAQDER